MASDAFRYATIWLELLPLEKLSGTVNVVAAELPTRFELPKKYAKRGSDATYTRSVRDMVIDATPKFEAWFEKSNKELSPARSGGKVKVSVEAIEAGLVDFKALAAETRKKMGASFSKGQTLGKIRVGKAGSCVEL